MRVFRMMEVKSCVCVCVCVCDFFIARGRLGEDARWRCDASLILGYVDRLRDALWPHIS